MSVEQLTADGLWYPRCGQVFHDTDIEANPDQFWVCPLCHAVQHQACRHLSDDTELQALLVEMDRLRQRVVELEMAEEVV